MKSQCRVLLLGVALPLLLGRFGPQNGKIDFEIVSTAAANQTAAVFYGTDSEPFKPKPTAVNDAEIEQILALKANGDFERIAELYSRFQDGRVPFNPLDQGGENFSLATMIPNLPYNDAGSTAGAQNDYDTNFGGCPVSAAPDVVYRYNPTIVQTVVVELCGSSYDTKLMVFQNLPTSPVACNDDACGLSSQVTVTMHPGNTYYIVVDGFNASSFGPYVIQVREDTPCDVVPPPHAVRECAFEVPGPTHYKKDCNGGCNNETVPGQYDLDRFDGICAGSPVAGTCFTYVRDIGGNARDTDWFLFRMTMPGPVNLMAQSEFPATIGIVNLDNCIAPSFVQSTSIPPCSPGTVSVPLLNPGTYAAFIAPSVFTGVETPLEYVMELFYPTQPSVCNCPLQEFEPNDNMERATPIPGPGLTLCGEISCPMDGDYYVIQLPFPTALRVHLRGSAANGSCPAGQGLHPYCEIITEDGREIALCGDQTNQATWFDSDFKFGPYRYYFHVGGANYTTGPYEIEIEMIQLSLVSCNPITVTAQPDNGGALLRWQGGLLPSDMVRIEYRDNAFDAFQTLMDVPPNPPNFFDPGSEPFREYQLRVIGGREPELSRPWVGSTIGLGESTGPNGEYAEVGEYSVDQIEWAVGPDNVAIQTLLNTTGIGPSTGNVMRQDRRDLYQQGYQPIASFSGHWMDIDGRKVLIDHVAFARDPVQGDVGVIDGRGMNETMDTLMYFGNQQVYLLPNNGGVSGAWFGWLWWWWWDDWFCPSICCQLKSIAFCTSTGAGAPPGCASPPLRRCPCNPDCWLGCPCDPPVPPDPAFCCPPVGPPLPPRYPTGCSGCTLVPFVEPLYFVIYCQCAAEDSPPTSGRCFFMIFVKCKTYCPCPEFFNICGCAVTPCPGPAAWTLVPFVGPALRAACKTNCVIGGPGC